MARCGVASRRASEMLIEAGRVTVNGVTVTRPGTTVDADVDRVEVDGRLIRPPSNLQYVMLNKPRGYVTTARDPQGRPTVMDLVKDIENRLYPVGRLDVDTEGLLLLTNDGHLANKLMHPRYEIGKRYNVTVRGSVDDETLRRLADGVELEDGKTAPARVLLLSRGRDRSIFELTIVEGRNRQVRRMCRHVGHPVIKLRRIAVGPVKLGALPPGTYRHLSNDEVHQLRRATAGC